MGDDTKQRRPLKSFSKAFTIVDAIRELDGASAPELAAHVDMPQSTVYRYVDSLEHEQLVRRVDGEYRLGLRFLDYGMSARRRYVLGVAKAKTEELARETDERSHYIVEEYGKGVVIHRAVGDHAIHVDLQVGKQMHLHNTAAGKVILAHLPEKEVERVLDEHGLPERTPNTITSRDDLATELERVRERGYAYNMEERKEGIVTVGAPVRDPDRGVLGAITVAGAARRMSGDRLRETLPNLLSEVTNEIELRLKYHDSPAAHSGY